MPPRPRPLSLILREGNPGHRSRRELEGGVRLPPGELEEPVWLDTFPVVRGPHAAAQRAVNARCRLVAAREWRRVVPVLEWAVGVSEVDLAVVVDYCVCVARVDQCERLLSRQGVVVETERGWVKNGAATIVGQYRTALRGYISELGLSPAARRHVPGRSRGDNDDSTAFDL